MGFTVDRKVKYNTFARTSIYTSKESAWFDPLPGVPIDRMDASRVICIQLFRALMCFMESVPS